MTRTGFLSFVDHLADPATGERVSQVERYRNVVSCAVAAEAVGFDAVGLGEHHFSDYILPVPQLMLAHVAASTTRVQLMTTVTLLANLDPLRVAEDLATLDVLSDGRAGAAVARGVSDATAAAFGVGSWEELRPRFAEGLRLVLELFTEDDVVWRGRYRPHLEHVRIQPRPVRRPHPPIWVGGGLSTTSADLAAELGLPFMLPSLFRYPEDYVEIVVHYREQMEANGFGDRVCIGYPSYVHVAATSQQARQEWRPHLEQYTSFALGDRKGFGRPTDFEGLLAGPAICGSVAEVTDRMGQVNELLGLDLHWAHVDLGGLPHDRVCEQVELLGSEVLPALG